MMTGIAVVAGSCFSFASTSRPLIRGIMMSSRMQSGWRLAICASAFAPSIAVITSYPRPLSIRAVMRVTFSLSSTTRIVSGIVLPPLPYVDGRAAIGWGWWPRTRFTP